MFGSRIGDAPEHILASKVSKSLSEWHVDQPWHVLHPQRDYEGAKEIIVPSRKGDGPPYLINQLRDPYLFQDDDGKRYLLYAIGGERGIAIAEFLC